MMNGEGSPRIPAGLETSRGPSGLSLSLGDLQGRVDGRLVAWAKADYLRRLWARDPGLWTPGPAAGVRERMGWLDLPETMGPRLRGIRSFADEIAGEGFRHAVVLGMGGSSLAPEVFERTFGHGPGRPDLLVLDSTHPAAVAGVERRVDFARTLFIVSSKSGTTVEPLSFFRYFWRLVSGASAAPGRQFIAITDPGTPLTGLARERGFRRVFEAAPDVGGRFSALTEFGLVPAALIGVGVDGLLAGAAAEARANGPDVPAVEAPGLRLGAALGETGSVRDKLTILTSRGLRSFPDWLEQLIAESTGKDGKGIVPVAGEPPLPAARYGADRTFVSFVLKPDRRGGDARLVASLEQAGYPVIGVGLADVLSLGAEIFRWEMAVAAAGSVLGVQPFDQPDVELAKELARNALDRDAGREGKEPISDDAMTAESAAGLGAAMDRWLGRARRGDYVAIQAYLAPERTTASALQELRSALLRRTGLATTLGYGPRFLHSTGQLQKGGPDEALVLQLFDQPESDLAIPETGLTFGRLIRAQAFGDYQALAGRGRRILRLDLGRDPAGGLSRLAELAAA